MGVKIIISGGGTGGHIYPAITILQTIKMLAPNAEILYVGTKQGLEADIVPKANIPFRGVNLSGGLKRSFTFENFLRLGQAAKAVKEAFAVVRKFSPQVVIGTGGYVCGPVLLAANMLSIPTLVQEQNAVAGITNKILALFASRVAVGMEGAIAKFPAKKTLLTGNPIRSDVLSANREEGLAAFSLSPAKKTILISGGSRGARSINNAMVDVLASYKDSHDLQFIHVTGKGEYEGIVSRLKEGGVTPEKCSHIKVFPYLYNMPMAEAAADLAVFRAGATGIAELTARGVPSILIPYPYAAENHQEYNARCVEKAGGAKVILNKDLTPSVLRTAIDEIICNEEKLSQMGKAAKTLGRPEAATEIAKMALNLATGQEFGA